MQIPAPSTLMRVSWQVRAGLRDDRVGDILAPPAVVSAQRNALGCVTGFHALHPRGRLRGHVHAGAGAGVHAQLEAVISEDTTRRVLNVGRGSSGVLGLQVQRNGHT